MVSSIIFVAILFNVGLKPTLANLMSLDQHPELLGDEETKIVSTILGKADSLSGKLSLDNFTYYYLAVTSKVTPNGDPFIRPYDKPDELEVSGGPEANQGQCLSQLQDLDARVELLASQRGHTKDLNLVLLLDTWGRRPSGMFLGHHQWPGAYNECKRRKIKTSSGSSRLRYCWALMKQRDWPPDELYYTKIGLCLPVACDSIQYQNKYQLIERMLLFNNEYLSEANLSHLYCLPDEQSPMRIWWHSSKSAIFVGLLAAWLLMIAYSTWTGRFKSLSLKNNLKLLFNMKRKEQAEKRLVDLSVLEGFKVISACGFIIAHTLFFFATKVTNMNEINQNYLEFIFVAWGVIVPCFAVDVFFTMTGILMAYLSFKSDTIPLATRPKVWFQLILFRYIKIMPSYAIVTAYAKYISKYTGSGPFWDYGNNNLSPRLKCEQESWLWTLLYGAIWKHPLDHCVPTAWYLSNDFLFVLVTPILFQVLHCRPKLGQFTLLVGMLASYLSTSFRIYNVTEDLRPLLGPTIYGVNILLNNIFDTYLLPHHRIAPYLAGLLIGYKLFEFERKALSEDQKEKKCELPKLLTEYGKAFCLFWLLLMFMWPYLIELIGANGNRSFAHFLMYSLYPFGHLVIGTVSGIIIMLASTGHTSNSFKGFLAAPIWRPFSKVGLLVAIINIEVVNYLLQTRTLLLYGDNLALSSFCVAAVVMVHLVAMILYLLFEAPFGALIESTLLKPSMKSGKQGTTSKSEEKLANKSQVGLNEEESNKK